MKLIRELTAALNRHSEALEALANFPDDLENAAFDLKDAAWQLDTAVDNLKSVRVDSEVST